MNLRRWLRRFGSSNHGIQATRMEEMEREQKEFKEITNNMGEGFLLLRRKPGDPVL